MKSNNYKQKLDYRIIEATTEDPDYPIFELLKGNFSINKGWIQMDGFPQDFVITHKKF